MGRAYCLWLACRHLGHEVKVLGPQRGPFWRPLQGTDFQNDCRAVSRWPLRHPSFEREIAASDLVIAVKTWPASFGSGLVISRRLGLPLLLDIDEDDYGALLGPDAGAMRRVKSLARMPSRGTSPRAFSALQLAAKDQQIVRLVSNPALLKIFPSSNVVPHVRPVAERPRQHVDENLRVAFIGTLRAHKGLVRLRRATSSLDGEVRLVITAPPPRDASPHEEWVGVTSLERGRAILSACDVLVTASSLEGYGVTQLPAKLIDAMSLGVVGVGTDTLPIRWALENGDAGILLRGDSTEALAKALKDLTNPALRRRLSERAHLRARDTFSVPAVADTVRHALSQASKLS